MGPIVCFGAGPQALIMLEPSTLHRRHRMAHVVVLPEINRVLPLERPCVGLSSIWPATGRES
jgi:hypothetical protein